ncbi:MAG: DUF2905 domain-containing protein [Actinomycetota bacterium]
MDLSALGKVLLIGAAVLALLGLVLLLAGKGVIPRMPGDLSFGKGNARVFIPLGTSLLLSVVLTIVLNLFLRR